MPKNVDNDAILCDLCQTWVHIKWNYLPDFDYIQESNWLKKFLETVLSPFLFIIVMEATSRELGIGCPRELLYTYLLISEVLK